MIGKYVMFNVTAGDTWRLEVEAATEPTQEECVVFVRNRYPEGDELVEQKERIGSFVRDQKGDLVPQHQTGSVASRRRTALLATFVDTLRDVSGSCRVRKI
jgi:hypothetical protein